MPDVSVTWLGHASFRVDSPNGKRVYVDPWLDNPKCPDGEKKPERADVIAVTHGHSDHVGSAVAIAKKFTLTNAFHSSSSDDGDYLGEATGIVIQFENGTTLYFAGDTCVFSDMELIGRIYSPDIAVLPIGGHFTMDPREAGVALELLGTKRCIPCHYGTFPLLTGTPDELRQHAPGVEILALEPGETITV